MNKELTDLFEGLNKLCAETEAFYFSEQEYSENITIRSYTYRLASWSDFKLPYAKQCRGTAFAYNKETKEWSLFCRAYPKFFNLGEGVPTEEYIAANTPVTSFEKLDGSLILFGLIDGKVVAKSKTSINSDHAKQANALIADNQPLYDYLYSIIGAGETPVLELVGPEFKIVLNYEKTELILLGFVNHTTGTVRTSENTRDNIINTLGIRKAFDYKLSWEELVTIQETSKPHIEGFVVLCDNDEFVKVKVQSYVNLHHLKDDINNLTNLIPLILEDSLDDIMGQFQDDQVTLDYISEVQEKIAHKFNHLVVEYKELRGNYFNKFQEDRKEFAIKYNTHPLFGYVMKKLTTSFRDIEKTAEDGVKQYILNNSKKQQDAKAFLASC